MATDVDNIINTAANPVEAILITASAVTGELYFKVKTRT